uniref:Uncharacterized protein n=1 Tax=Cacopsylla melanoneura TaxID=428564 RepID=A0A8D8VTB2_9HEMI
MTFAVYCSPPAGYFTFDIVPHNERSPLFTIGHFEILAKTFHQTKKLRFEYFRTAAMNSSSKAELENIPYLRLSEGDDLLSKLQTIQSEIFKDSDLVKDINDLTRKLNQKPEVSSNQNRLGSQNRLGIQNSSSLTRTKSKIQNILGSLSLERAKSKIQNLLQKN